MSHRVQVVVRFRPQNETEKEHGGPESVTFPRSGEASSGPLTEGVEEEVDVPANRAGAAPKQYTFDGVLPPTTTQRQLFEKVGINTVDTVMKGYNGTVLAYGQTGSGKTHSMFGPSGGTVDVLNKTSPFYPERGFLPRVVEALFAKLEALAEEEVSWTVTVSVFELYKENINDLLGQHEGPADDNTEYRIREDSVGGKGIYVENLFAKKCGSASEVMEALGAAVGKRKVSSTKSNETSSRSHSLTVLTVEQVHHVRGDSVTRARLNVVDLAGSEKVGKTQATGERLKEAQMINLSLTLLGNVIYKLTDGKSVYIPYRDSKLTRLLQEAFGGNACTTLLCHASMAAYNREETIGTLQFAARAKQIKNKPRVNRQLSGEELQLAYNRAIDEVRSLKDRLSVFEDHKKDHLPSTLSPTRIRTTANEDDEGCSPQQQLLSARARRGDASGASDPPPDDLMALLAEKDEEIDSLRATVASIMREKEEIQRDVAERDELLEASKRQVEFYKEKWTKATSEAQRAVELEKQMKYKEDLFSRHKLDMEAEIANLKAQLTGSGAGKKSSATPNGRKLSGAKKSDLEDGGSELMMGGAVGSGLNIRRNSASRGGMKRPMQKQSLGGAGNNANRVQSLVEPLPMSMTTGGGEEVIIPPSVGAHVTVAMPEQLIVKDGDKRGDILQPYTPPRDLSAPGGPPPLSSIRTSGGHHQLTREENGPDVPLVDHRLEAELRLRISALESELSEMKIRMGVSITKVTELTATNHVLVGRIENIEDENDSLKKELDGTNRVLAETEKENQQMKDILDSLGINLKEQLKLLGSERTRNQQLHGDNAVLTEKKSALELQQQQQEMCDMVSMEFLVKTEDVEAIEREVEMLAYQDFAIQRATSMSCMRTCGDLAFFFEKVVEQLEIGTPSRDGVAERKPSNGKRGGDGVPFGTANLEAQRLNLIEEAQLLLTRCAVVRSAITD